MADDVKAPLGAGAGHDELPIDVELLKVLSSDSRRDILRLLDKRRMTLSELSVALGLKKATVLEHLKKLVDAGLIRRMEDERLWVYYELTHRGGRLVNPGRTRFFLVLGLASAAAAVLLGIAAMAVTFSGAPGDDASAVGRGGLHAEVLASEGGLVAGAPVTLRASAVAPEGFSEIERALLLTPTDVRALQYGRLHGIPLTPVRAEGGEVDLVSRGPVPAGEYYLYVSDARGRDNADALPTVRVPALAVEGPEVAWRSLDEAATFKVASDGAPANGTLLLVASGGSSSARPVVSAHLADGRARFNASTLDALAPGAYAMQLLPEARNDTVPLAARVDVRDARPVVAPRDLQQGSDGLVRVTLAPTADLAPGNVRVLVDGAPVDAERVAPHVLLLRLDASEPGTRQVQVGRLPPQAVTIHPALRLDLARDEDASLRVRALGAEGAPVPNVTLLVDDDLVGATDANGTLSLGNLTEGRHVLRFLHRHAEATHVVQSDGANVSLVPRAVGLSVEAPSVGEQDVRLVVTLRDAWPVEAPLVVTARLGGEVVALQRVTTGGAQGGATLSFHVPKPGAGEHALHVQAAPPPFAPLNVTLARAVLYHGSAGYARDDMSAEPTPTSPTPPMPTVTAPTASGPTAGAPAGDAAHEDSAMRYVRVSPSEVVVPLRFAPTPVTPPTTPTYAGFEGAANFAPTPEVPAPGLLLVAAALVAVALARRRLGRA